LMPTATAMEMKTIGDTSMLFESKPPHIPETPTLVLLEITREWRKQAGVDGNVAVDANRSCTPKQPQSFRAHSYC